MLGELASPFEAMRAGMRAFLEACRTPEVQRIVLIDGPAVLGWERWREVAERNGLGLIEAVVAAAIEAGEIDTARRRVARAPADGRARRGRVARRARPDATDAVAATLERLVDGLRVAS